MTQKPALFLDLFGTLVEDHDRCEAIDNMTFKAAGFDAVRTLQNAGYLIFISVCHAGSPLPDALYVKELKDRVKKEFRAHCCDVDEILFLSDAAPHNKKNEVTEERVLTVPGIDALAKKYDLDLQRCVIIGDLMVDVYLGRELTMKTVLISSQNDSPGYEAIDWIEPDYLAASLDEVVENLVSALSD
jgi:histidinol phosphatase-like enzyme